MNKQKIRNPDFALEENEAFSLPLGEVERKLKTNLETGLTTPEAECRLQKAGPNSIPKIGVNRMKMYLAPLSNWLIAVYLIVSTILAFLAIFILPQLWFQIAVWLPIISGNIVVIIVQSIRAEKGLNALQKLASPKSNVRREGKITPVSSENLVPGDIVQLKQGDIIPADLRIISSTNLRVNEAILTGESADVEKSLSKESDENQYPTFQKQDALFLGTSIVTGNALAVVVETGRNTQIGKMAGKLRIESAPEISLRKRINVLAKNLTYIVLIYVAISLIYSVAVLYFFEGQQDNELLAQNIAKSLITALNIMPVSIPLLVTIVMLAGALYMVKSNVIVRNLNAIESAGRLTVLCTDKTGTITQNKMTAKFVYTPVQAGQEKLYYITSQDSQDKGKIAKIDTQNGFEKAIQNPKDYQDPARVEIQGTSLEYLLASALLNNDRPIFGEDGNEGETKACNIDTSKKITSDATDVAMLCLFERSILEPEAYTGRFSLVQSWPLDSKTKLITRVFKDNRTNRFLVFVKGSTESLLNKSDRLLSRENVTEAFSEEHKKQVLGRAELLSQKGERIVSFALKEFENFDQNSPRELGEKSLTFIGLVGIADPPRQGINAAVSELRDAGVKSVMITGDSLATARSIANEIGLIDGSQLVIEGSQINNLPDEDFLKVAVFARTSPDDKKAIVGRYKDLNCVVAMTGDGVNDAQAIHSADVGIAMGATGTDVARQAAGVVLADDSFNSIVTGIREGRGVFEKIQNVVFFYVAISLAEGLVFFAASFIQGFLLLQTWQLIYIAISQFAPSIALVTDKLSSDVMKFKPRKSEGLLGGNRRTALIIYALTLASLLTVVYLFAMNDILPYTEPAGFSHLLTPDFLESAAALGYDQARARTMLLTVAIVSHSALVRSLRRFNKPLLKSLREDRNWKIWPLVISMPIFQAILMYSTGIQEFFSMFGINFELAPLEAIDWFVVLAFSLLPVAIIELMKLFWIRRART